LPSTDVRDREKDGEREKEGEFNCVYLMHFKRDLGSEYKNKCTEGVGRGSRKLSSYKLTIFRPNLN
jgi:hypothetical protein